MLIKGHVKTDVLNIVGNYVAYSTSDIDGSGIDGCLISINLIWLEGAQIKVAYNMSIIKVRAAYNVDGAAKWSDWKLITIILTNYLFPPFAFLPYSLPLKCKNMAEQDIRENTMSGGTPARLRGLAANGNSISPTIQEVAETFGKGYAADLNNETDYGISGMFNADTINHPPIFIRYYFWHILKS